MVPGAVSLVHNVGIAPHHVGPGELGQFQTVVRSQVQMKRHCSSSIVNVLIPGRLQLMMVVHSYFQYNFKPSKDFEGSLKMLHRYEGKDNIQLHHELIETELNFAPIIVGP